ncbi:MAG: hypothetical protein JXR25_09340 [Pontiellaceae bacterium]|nr:hypothetical protein [Pontiellaceae bacterium]MBN2785019.1 hypothetical protein [Pontiellaceae bacterium]
MDKENLGSLDQIAADHQENKVQIHDRVAHSSAVMDADEMQMYSTFKGSYDQWSAAGGQVLQDSSALKAGLLEQQSKMNSVSASFAAMRDDLDQVVGLIEAQTAELIKSDAGAASAVPLLDATCLLVNADRDLYQSFVALLSLYDETDLEKIQAHEATYLENADQVKERCAAASAVFSAEAKTAYANFLAEFESWNALAVSVFQQADEIAVNVVQRKMHAAESDQAFAVMRGHLDKLGASIESRIDASIIQIKGKASDAESELALLEQENQTVKNTVLVLAGLTVLFVTVLLIWSVQRMVHVLSAMVRDLKAGSENVASASHQIASSAQSQASGASEQAAALEESVSSLEEISTITDKSATSAETANELAAGAAGAATAGSEAMRKVEAAMNDIRSSSSKTANIVKVIDEIAFQTNLLALNAAVEAARAGEAGRGFAVVAEEVRNLARRSAEAARETTALIDEAVSHAKNGEVVVSDAEAALIEIVEKVSGTSALIEEIAGSSREQAIGLTQISAAITQIDRVTQGNAAHAEESASAATELLSQAQSMDEIVGALGQLVMGVSG